ncbi:MAG: Uma2 family endonuclease, partial [Planctomycetia bacterium]|nr:Uma2 family endonuclease [Planctomycetia bacterium]
FHPDGNYFIGADTGIFWQIAKEPLEGCKAPDWYYIPNVPRLIHGDIRRSYVLWEEFGRPLIVIEFVSGDGSEERDTTPAKGKFWVYEHAVAATYYLIWDRSGRTLEAYELWRGRYRPIGPNEHARYPIPAMEVEFGIWDGVFLGYQTCWLRAWNREGQLLPTPQERAERLAARLRELGVDPDTV